MAKKFVYVYYDLDHGDIEVCSSLEKAKAIGSFSWGDEAEWEMIDANEWELGEYCYISKREVR